MESRSEAEITRRSARAATSARIPVTLVTARSGAAPASRLELVRDAAIVVGAGAALAVLATVLWCTAVGSAADVFRRAEPTGQRVSPSEIFADH